MKTLFQLLFIGLYYLGGTLSLRSIKPDCCPPGFLEIYRRHCYFFSDGLGRHKAVSEHDIDGSYNDKDGDHVNADGSMYVNSDLAVAIAQDSTRSKWLVENPKENFFDAELRCTEMKGVLVLLTKGFTEITDYIKAHGSNSSYWTGLQRLAQVIMENQTELDDGKIQDFVLKQPNRWVWLGVGKRNPDFKYETYSVKLFRDEDVKKPCCFLGYDSDYTIWMYEPDSCLAKRHYICMATPQYCFW